MGHNVTYVGINWDNTTDTQREIYSLDFGRILGIGEVIVTSNWTILLKSTCPNATPDPDPSAALIGASQITGSVISQMVGPLVQGNTYEMTAIANTSRSQTLALCSLLTCSDPL